MLCSIEPCSPLPAPIPMVCWLESFLVFPSLTWPGLQFTGDQIKFNGNICVQSCSGALACKDKGHLCASEVALGFIVCLTSALRPWLPQGRQHPLGSLHFLFPVPFHIMSEARPHSQRLFPCDGLPRQAPVSAV